MIPKIIHYCWFGNNKMPEDQKTYIDKWKELMPDYKFKCWTEKNININKTPFTKQAYEASKYAYVADYARIYALYHEGGIYMDTDVELRVSLEPFRKHGIFTSYEYTPRRKQIKEIKAMLTPEGERIKRNVLERIPGTGLFSALIGSTKEHPFMKDCMDYYNSHSFEEVFAQHLTVPNILAFHAEKYGLKYLNIEQHIDKDIAIYNNKIFASALVANKQSLAIHHCAASWVKQSFKEQLRNKIYNISWIRSSINILFPKE